jgi:hypothetical protein
MTITANGDNGCKFKTYIIKMFHPLGALNSPGSTQNLVLQPKLFNFHIQLGSNLLDTTYKVNYGDGSSIPFSFNLSTK